MRNLIFLFIIMTCLISCGKKEVKKVSDESRTAREAFELAETLKTAYLDHDRKTLEENTTKDGFRELIGTMKSFDSAKLSFTPTWVEIEAPVVYLTVSWKGTWTVQDKKKEERGTAVFVMEGSPLKLAQIQRANPFQQPE